MCTSTPPRVSLMCRPPFVFLNAIQLLTEDAIAARGWLVPATEASLGGSSGSGSQSMMVTSSSSAATPPSEPASQAQVYFYFV